MTLFSVPTTDGIFVKSYGFLPFTKNMRRIIGKNTSKTLKGKYSQKLIDHAKKSPLHAFITS